MNLIADDDDIVFNGQSEKFTELFSGVDAAYWIMW